MRDRATQKSNTGVQPLDHHTAEPLTKGGAETNSSDVAEITEAEFTEPLPLSPTRPARVPHRSQAMLRAIPRPSLFTRPASEIPGQSFHGCLLALSCFFVLSLFSLTFYYGRSQTYATVVQIIKLIPKFPAPTNKCWPLWVFF